LRPCCKAKLFLILKTILVIILGGITYYLYFSEENKTNNQNSHLDVHFEKVIKELNQKKTNNQNSK